MPAIWTDETFHHGKSHEFWEDAKGFALAEGLSFAVHEQPGVTGIFSLARDQALALSSQDLAALVGRAQMFASLLHHAVARIDLPKLLPEKATPLTSANASASSGPPTARPPGRSARSSRSPSAPSCFTSTTWCRNSARPTRRRRS